MAAESTIFAGLYFLAGRNEGLFTLSWTVIGSMSSRGLLLLAPVGPVAPRPVCSRSLHWPISRSRPPAS
jgi:hypothetical protein